MSLPAPSIFDRTKEWIRLFTRQWQPPSPIHDENTNTSSFANAHDFTINGSNFINELKVNYINDVVSSKQAVFELLEPYTCLDAAKDSSARYPPPRCHPETRLKIRERLTRWLFHESDGWKMMWVRGSAGTGKSAVAQSFGDACGEKKKHGASYFFSRAAGRNKLETVVPTIVSQLAATIPEYRSLIGHQLANNPLLLRQSPPVQFRDLIVGPFATLQRQRPWHPVVIILDGLDECEGEGAQRDILEMVTNAIRANPDLPLRWLIFSRPEAHLKNAFSRNLLCGREELIIDAECREDVERYVKERLVEVKIAYNEVTPSDWPPPDKLQELLDAVSGLFIFASTCLNFIDDPDEADPSSQLDSLLIFLRRSQGVMSRSPLAVLDQLYSQILEKISPAVYRTTRRILAFMCFRDKLDRAQYLASAQALANFLHLNQCVFYKAVRGLYSVMSIPEPEVAAESQLRFYHASFQDFLLDPNRSGKFSVHDQEQEALLDIIQCDIYWYEVDVTHFHTKEAWNSDQSHTHDSLPGLTWTSESNRSSVSQSITAFLDDGLFNPRFGMRLDVVNESLLSQLSDINFRYWLNWDVLLLTRLCQLDPSCSLVRIEPSSPTDHKLLEYFYRVIDNGVARPARLPPLYNLPDKEWIRQFFIIGYGMKSVILWRTKSATSLVQSLHSLRCDQEPSEAQISGYADYLRQIEWDEARAKSEMT